MSARVLFLPDCAATEREAARLALLFRRGDLLTLKGPLGSGKTAFARGLLTALGVEGPIPSPTFTLMQIYETPRLLITHFDFYRLASDRELLELGWEDALEQGFVLAEWPERVQTSLPPDRLDLHFSIHEKDERHVRIEPFGGFVGRLEHSL